MKGSTVTIMSQSMGTGFFFFIKSFVCLFIYLFMAALGLRCRTQAFSSCAERGLLFIAMRGLVIAVASHVAEHRF